GGKNRAIRGHEAAGNPKNGVDTDSWGLAPAWYRLCVIPGAGREQAMISTMVRTLSRVPISLRGLAVCVACEECFELGDPTCPTCGSDEYVPLLHQLEGRILNMTSNN